MVSWLKPGTLTSKSGFLKVDFYLSDCDSSEVLHIGCLVASYHSLPFVKNKMGLDRCGLSSTSVAQMRQENIELYAKREKEAGAFKHLRQRQVLGPSRF